MRFPLKQKWFLTASPALYLIVFFAIPTLLMMVASFRNPGDFGGLAPFVLPDGSWDITLEAYQRFFEDSVYFELFLKSFAYAIISTFACLLMAYPLAYWMANSPARFRDLLVLLVILPFASNLLIRVYAWMMILGPQSFFAKLINWPLGLIGMEPLPLLFTPFAVILGLVYVHLPFMVLPLYINLEKHDPALLNAAQDLGANSWQRFWKVTFPLSLPGIYSGSALVFIPVLGMFAVPDLLGGTQGIMIANVIKDQILGTRDWPFGSALSMLLTAGVLGFVSLVALGARHASRRAPL